MYQLLLYTCIVTIIIIIILTITITTRVSKNASSWRAQVSQALHPRIDEDRSRNVPVKIPFTDFFEVEIFFNRIGFHSGITNTDRKLNRDQNYIRESNTEARSNRKGEVDKLKCVYMIFSLSAISLNRNFDFEEVGQGHLQILFSTVLHRSEDAEFTYAGHEKTIC